MEAPPFHLSDFLSAGGRAGELAAQLSSTPPFPPHLRHALLSGPERCGKTSLLLSYAYSLAARGLPVLLLCWRCAAVPQGSGRETERALAQPPPPLASCSPARSPARPLPLQGAAGGGAAAAARGRAGLRPRVGAGVD